MKQKVQVDDGWEKTLSVDSNKNKLHESMKSQNFSIRARTVPDPSEQLTPTTQTTPTTPLSPGRPNSNLKKWELGLIPTPLKPDRPYSNLADWVLGLILTPLKPGRPYSNLENWVLGLILTPLKPGRPNSYILEVVTEQYLIFSNTL